MKKNYIKPSAESASLNTYEIMQGLQIPISGGTTPEESDAKQTFFSEEEDDGWQQSDYNLWDN